MNYQKHYNNLINKAQNRLLEGYIEEHHIIPKCMDGSNSRENLVQLTAEEHYVAHQLLVKMYPNNHKLIYAAILMSADSNGNRLNNRLYGWIKKRRSEALKGKTYEELYGEEKAQVIKEKISKAGKGRILGPPSIETRQKMSEAKKGFTYEDVHGMKKATEIKEKLSILSSGKSNGFYGKTHSIEAKVVISNNNKKRFKNKENHPRYGATLTAEHKEKLSSVHKGKILSNKTRQKMSKSKKGKRMGKESNAYKFLKGKTYEEIYGPKKAAELKKLRRRKKIIKETL